MMKVDSETAKPFAAERVIGITDGAVTFDGSRRQCGNKSLLDISGLKGTFFQLLHFTQDTNRGRKSDDEKQIASAPVDEHFQPSIQPA
jgi:hypothetical protein